jgi:hypothetical protein
MLEQLRADDVRRMLAVGVDDQDPIAMPLLADAVLDRRAVTKRLGMPIDTRSELYGALVRPVTRAIVDHDHFECEGLDPCEDLSEFAQQPGKVGGFVERRDHDAHELQANLRTGGPGNQVLARRPRNRRNRRTIQPGLGVGHQRRKPAPGQSARCHAPFIGTASRIPELESARI